MDWGGESILAKRVHFGQKWTGGGLFWPKVDWGFVLAKGERGRDLLLAILTKSELGFCFGQLKVD